MICFGRTTIFLILGLAACQALALNDQELEKTVKQRLSGDRTGACFAVAVIEQSTVKQTFVCADPEAEARINSQTAFEIGSITKTMTGTLLAVLIAEGKAALEDPLKDYLPKTAKVPDYDGKPVRLRHIVTHTSGLPALPPGIERMDPQDPYANIGEKQLLDALSQTTIEREPGSQYEYSNYATMLLSWAISRRFGKDFSTLVTERIFKPLNMHGAFVQYPAQAVQRARGHIQSGAETPPWTFKRELAGVGGVNATLEDMVQYARAHLESPMRQSKSTLAAAMALTHEPVATSSKVTGNVSKRPIFWSRIPFNDGWLLAHGGGTGGFSSFLALDTEAERAAIVLSDTSFTALGGVSNLALHLLDPDTPLEKPRKKAIAAEKLLNDLAGLYQLNNGMNIELGIEDKMLTVKADTQPAFKMAFDSHGDFYPLDFDALLVPVLHDDGRVSIVWHQSGAQFTGRRVNDDDSANGFEPGLALLRSYTGDYTLQSDFILTIRVRQGVLTAQATGQDEFPLEPVEKDVFDALQFGIEIVFERDDTGEVTGLQLLQNGNETTAKRTSVSDQ